MASLTRSQTNRIIGGVCGGVAEHFGWDPTIVRLGFLAAIVLGGGGLWVYLVIWAVMPAEDGSSGVSYAREMWSRSKSKRDDGDTFDPYRGS